MLKHDQSANSVRGFVTVCCMGHYVEVLGELLDCLFESRLYDKSHSVDLAVLGGDDAQQTVREMIRPFEKIRIAYASNDYADYEFPALALLQAACRESNDLVYYLHTKGVSRGPLDQHARYWRALMLSYVVEKHAECLQALAYHDCVGTNWRGNHFSGNFWWSRAEHIRRLPDIQAMRRAPLFLSADPVWNARLQCEFWIGRSPGRFKNLGPEGLDLYLTLRWGTSDSDIINWLLAALDGSSYLEFRVAGAGLDRVHAQVRHLVSQEPAATFRMSEREFFSSKLGEHCYDVIFVDCLHEEQRCLEVMESALSRLSPHGALVVHDTNPPTEWHQRPSADYIAGSEWNGEAWKAVVRFRQQHPEVEVTTVDTDWGCTVIRPSSRARPRIVPAREQPLTWDNLQKNRTAWLNVVSVRRFRREIGHLPYTLGHARLARRADLINVLLSRFGLERYLEIGLDAPREDLEQIWAPVRHSVAHADSATFRMTSDHFFAGQFGCERYDLIVVDGLHEEEQRLRDVESSLDRLSPDGIVVVPDTNPPSEWRHSEQVSEGNGGAWKVLLRIRRQYPTHRIFTVDLDRGYTVISNTVGLEPSELCDSDPTWSDFDRNRKAWLKLISVEDFCELLRD